MLVAVAALFVREIRRFYRDRSRIIGTLVTPLVLFGFIAGGFSGVVSRVDGDAFGSYLLPGTLALSVMMTAIFSTISIIEDRKAGFLQSALVAPVSRGALVLAKVAAGATLGLMQATLVLVPLALIEHAFTLSLMPGALLALFVCGAALTALGFALAWFSESTQGYHGMMNGLLMPMWALSGSLFPREGAASVVAVLMTVNPLTPFVALLRATLRSEGTAISLWTAPALWTLGFLGLALWSTTRASRAVAT